MYRINQIKLATLAVLAVILAVVLMLGFSYINEKIGVEDDNVVEEILEHQILKETGISTDLSPDTEEK